MKKSEMRQIIREEYKKLTESIKDYEDVLGTLYKASEQLKRADYPLEDDKLEKQINNFQNKLDKLVDNFETLISKVDKKL